jgi:hypothetical protein
MRPWLTLLVAPAFFVSVAGGEAAAQPPGLSSPPTETTTVETSYGWQIALADAAVIGTAIATGSGDVLLLGYLGSGPIVHLVHGNFGRAALSGGLRLGAPLAGGLLVGAMAAGSCQGSSDPFCGLGHVAAGALLGMGAAVLVDTFALATRTREVEQEPAALLRLGSLRANPTLGAPAQGGGLRTPRPRCAAG